MSQPFADRQRFLEGTQGILFAADLVCELAQGEACSSQASERGGGRLMITQQPAPQILEKLLRLAEQLGP